MKEQPNVAQAWEKFTDEIFDETSMDIGMDYESETPWVEYEAEYSSTPDDPYYKRWIEAKPEVTA